jgi:hypothetical protein
VLNDNSYYRYTVLSVLDAIGDYMSKEPEFNYYKDELTRLKADKCNYPISIKLFSEFDNTKQLDLNADSVPVLIEFLKKFGGL